MNPAQHLQVARAFVDAMGFVQDERVREADELSDIDMVVAVHALIPAEERLNKLRAIGCHHIILEIAGAHNPAMPVSPQVIDRLVFQDTWFDVSYHLPHQLEKGCDYITLVDKEDLSRELCGEGKSYSEEELKARAKTDLRLLHARLQRYRKYVQRQEWIGLDLSTAKNLMIDVVMVLNNVPIYNRFSSRISRMLSALPTKPPAFEQRLEDILNLDNRQHGQRKAEMLDELEADLTALCEARWGPLPLFDDAAPPPA